MGFLAAAAPFISLASTAVGAVGAIKSGEAQAADANYQSQVANNNAVIARQNAAYATKAGEANAYTKGLENRQKMGAVVAGLAAEGTDVNTGSPAAVREGEDITTYTDVERVRQDAALRAYGYNVQGSNYTAEGQLLQTEASQEEEAGFLKAGGLALAGISNVGWRLGGFTGNNPLSPGPLGFAGT